MILSRPDRADTANLYEYTSETPILEKIIYGEEEGVEEDEAKEDIIYLGIVPENVKSEMIEFSVDSKDFKNMPYPRPIVKSKYIWNIETDTITKDDNLSLSLCDVSGEDNLYSATIGNAPIVNARIRECIRFVSDEMPDVESIFLLRNKLFLCEKIEADIKADGMDRILTGYFYRIKS